MITSDQVNALIAQQQQQLGMMGAGQPQSGFAPMGGASQYPPQFNYGMAQGQASMASRAGGMLAGGAAAVPSALAGVGTAAGLASIVPAMMGRSAPMLGALSHLDPMTAGATGVWNAGASLMAGGSLGGAAAIAAPGLAVSAGTYAAYKGAQFGAQNFAEGFRQNNAMAAQTAGMQFLNPMAQGGRGMDPRGIQQMTSTMRKIDRDDPFASMKDTQQMMGQFTDMGMAQGVKDAEEFANKFKKMMDTVKVMAKTMGTTMGDAARTFGAMRQSGFYSSADVAGNTAQMRLGGALGISQQSFLQTQQQGAEFSRNMGIGGQAGARAMSGAQMSLAQEMQAGRMTEESVMDLTGAANREDATSMMAARLVQGNARFLSSAAGKGLLAASGQQGKDGRFTGHLDAGLMDEAISGGLEGLTKRGGGRTSSKGAKASFTSRQSEIAGAALSSEDFSSKIIDIIDASSSATDDDDIKALLYEKLTGADRPMYELARKLSDDSKMSKQELKRKLQQSKLSDAQSLNLRENRTFSGLATKIGGGIGDIAAAPFQAAGARADTEIKTSFQKYEDLAFGTSRYSLGDEDLDNAREQVFSGKSLDHRQGSMFNKWREGTGKSREGIDRILAGSGDTGDLFLTDSQKKALQHQTGLRAKGGAAGMGMDLYTSLSDQVNQTSMSDDLAAMGDAGGRRDTAGVLGAGANVMARFARAGMEGAMLMQAGGDTKVAAAALMARGPAGERAAQRLLGKYGTADPSSFLSQEGAKQTLIAKLTATGVSQSDAEEMASGKSGGLLAKFKGRKDPIAAIAAAREKATNELGPKATNEEIQERMAEVLQGELGGKISSADVAAAEKVTNRAASPIGAVYGAVRGMTAEEMVSEVANASSDLINTASNEELMTSAKAALKGVDDSVQSRAGFSTFQREAGTDIAKAFAEGGSAEKFLRGMEGMDDGELTALLDSGDQMTRGMAQQAKTAKGLRNSKAMSTAQIATAMGMKEEVLLKRMGREKGGVVSGPELEKAISTAERTTVGDIAMAGGTGGATTMGDPTQNLLSATSDLHTAVKHTLEISTMAYNASHPDAPLPDAPPGDVKQEIPKTGAVGYIAGLAKKVW